MRNGVRDDVAQPVFLDHRKMINTRLFSRYEPLQQLVDKGFRPSKLQSLKTSRTRTRHPVVQLPCCP
jgi:hypothetical protein